MKMAVRILHAADLHLDSPFDALSEDKAAQRRQEQREMLDRIADRAERAGAQIVLLSGDLLDSAASYYETHEALCRALGKMRAKVFIAPGNHDYYCAKSPYASLEFPENVHIFRSPAISCVELPELGCRVWGAAFTAQSAPAMLRGFSVPDKSGVDIMVLHGELGGDTYGPISEDDIASSGLDYLALGHVHTFSGVHRAGDTYYAYPGCPEGRGFDETGEKGVITGLVMRGKCELEFAALEGRRYCIHRCSLTDASDALQAIEESLPQDTLRDIYRIILTGEYDGKIDPNALQVQLADRFYQVVVRDETRPRRDIWAQADEDSLRGLFLQSLRSRFDAAQTDEEREKVVMAVRYGLAALDGGEEWRR